MNAGSLARPLAWMLVLAFLLPVAGFAESCDECLGGEQPGCCPPACSLCLCCGQGRTVLSGAIQMDRDPGLGSAFGDAAGAHALSGDSRDVFHVPKTFLI
ncbi:MAG TPA: hypothetical protein VJ725_31545 [Thermoanaerobaculia bacterium]|nr:hypothetical protein [Thermoanaerobaculia bacterium]